MRRMWPEERATGSDKTRTFPAEFDTVWGNVLI
ncbi:hypothetical protein JOE21_003198 [Desmospora profundinema]|uniref:Uncharacterized protein n=1 Tax=Desmospora profundinema TaxID=1571184 RepID=A0ABU1IR34_9BACL|nr:hypothetical protein [Desmospora profundinema]